MSNIKLPKMTLFGNYQNGYTRYMRRKSGRESKNPFTE